MNDPRRSHRFQGTRFIVAAIIGLILFASLIFHQSEASHFQLTVSPGPGVFLYAVPELADPNFLHTVVLLVAYSQEGATGVIINRRSDYSLEEALPEIEGIEGLSDPLYIGGPVSRDRLFFLLRIENTLDDTVKVFGDIHFSWSHQVLSDHLRKHEADDRLRVYSGIAGWGPGQLDREIARNDWVLAKASTHGVFSKDPSLVWPEIFNIQDQIEIDWREPILSFSTPKTS